MNANTVTANNGPTMKYHCTVVLAEKKKKQKEKILSHYGSSKHEGPEARQVRSLLKFIFYPRLSKRTTPLKKKRLLGSLMSRVSFLFVMIILIYVHCESAVSILINIDYYMLQQQHLFFLY